jgi:multidrug efflux pump subunit AcrA (membrane-fusion protein)
MAKTAGAAVILAGLILAACEAGDYSAEQRVRGLKTFEVADVERVSVRRFPGVLEPSELNVLSFETGGMLLDFDLDLGQRIATGDVVARLDPTSLDLQVEIAAAGVRQAEALEANAA